MGPAAYRPPEPKPTDRNRESSRGGLRTGWLGSASCSPPFELMAGLDAGDTRARRDRRDRSAAPRRIGPPSRQYFHVRSKTFGKDRGPGAGDADGIVAPHNSQRRARGTKNPDPYSRSDIQSRPSRRSDYRSPAILRWSRLSGRQEWARFPRRMGWNSASFTPDAAHLNGNMAGSVSNAAKGIVKSRTPPPRFRARSASASAKGAAGVVTVKDVGSRQMVWRAVLIAANPAVRPCHPSEGGCWCQSASETGGGVVHCPSTPPTSVIPHRTGFPLRPAGSCGAGAGGRAGPGVGPTWRPGRASRRRSRTLLPASGHEDKRRLIYRGLKQVDDPDADSRYPQSVSVIRIQAFD